MRLLSRSETLDEKRAAPLGAGPGGRRAGRNDRIKLWTFSGSARKPSRGACIVCSSGLFARETGQSGADVGQGTVG